MPVEKLADDELAAVLAQLPEWKIDNAKLHRQFSFPSFAHAMGFMMTAAIGIDKKNHHPEWSNVYNRVTVDLTTHDSGGITAKDVDLARTLNTIAATFNQQ